MSITSADVIVGVNLLDKDIHEIVEIANKITPNIIIMPSPKNRKV